MTARIPVGNTFALVDDEDVELVSRFTWYLATRPNGRSYAFNVKVPRRFMHRLIVDPAPGLFVDHVNWDGLDNRRINLRACTPTQNLANMRKRSTPCSSMYKGVCFDKGRNKWLASMQVNGRSRNLGRFEDEEAAACAYDAAALAEWGEYARLNFPLGDLGEAA